MALTINHMKTSAYVYLFNARKHSFDLDGMIENFTAIFDEVVIATITSEDDTLTRLLYHERRLPGQLKIVKVDIDINKTNRWDGELKTAALQACTKSTPQDPRVYVIMDGDERVPLSQKPEWDRMAGQCYRQQGADGFFVPVVDLWGDELHVRADQQPGLKFRMHKDTVVARGVIPQAERGNGLFDTKMSDSTEALLADGNLARFVPYIPFLGSFASTPFVLHYGHIGAERRAKLNREFWFEHWKKRSGEDPTMALSAAEVSKHKLILHNYPLK